MRKTALAVLLTALAPLSAHAGEVGYNYIELGYSTIDIDGTSVDIDGGALNGSALLGENFFIYGGYGMHDTDPGSVGIDTSRIGLGWRHGISDSSDLVINANYFRLDFGVGGVSGDVDGYEAEIGLRTAHGERFESVVALGYEDGDDASGDVFGRLSGHYKFNERWGIAANAVFHDGGKEYFIGPRLSF